MSASAPRGAEFGPLWSALKPVLCESSLAALSCAGFSRATPVQAAVVPLLCSNKDVSVEACTGSGKTLAFLLPLVELLRRAHAETALKKHDVVALVISPTRELARQILDVSHPFLAPLPGPPAMLLVGGSDPSADITRFHENGAHVLIGTPGRLDDVMARSGSLSLRRLELLVLDEADRLLSMGFSAQVGSILRRLPKQRRTGLFSATQTEEVEELARAGLRNPVRITVRDTAKGGPACGGKTPSQLSLYHGMCSGSDDKLPRLVAFLQRHAQHKVIVYFLTCACVDFYADALGGLPQLAALMLTPLHGRMKQSHRERALEQYSTASCGVLLATDVAARGLDIPGVDWVLQFDPPQDPAAFLHRCGRTARMGAAGASIAFLLPSEDAYLGFLALRSLQLVPAPDCQHAPPHSHNDAAQEQALFAALRGRAETEREFMEKAARAFVSFVRGYKEHQCRFIFRLKELELGRLARAFGLLRMPRMPETKRVDVSSTFQASAVVPDDVPYRDRAREKLRLARNREAAYEAAAAAAAAPHHVRAAPRVQPQAEQPASRAPTAQKRRLEQTRCDEDDLDADWKLLRKLKAGKISEHQYNVQAGLSSDSEQEQEQEQQARADKRPAKKQQQQHGRGNGKAQSRGGRGGGRR